MHSAVVGAKVLAKAAAQHVIGADAVRVGEERREERGESDKIG
jgi:hypothetical protein